MKTFTNRIVLLALALAIATASSAAEEKSEPFLSITADRMRAAFLEDAPAGDTKSMKAVLAEECERIREEPLLTEAGEPIDVAWLCRGKSLRYLIEVLLDGTKVDTGFICDPVGIEYVKFMPLDMVEHQRCVWVSYDYEAKVHDLDLDTQLGSAETGTETDTETKP
ncbi:MAG: hypothetical protein H7Y89_20260 [Steroidobacteraceae bacterium]|nr:hypothetical protein [Steroidobacteraceae bacterium]